MNLTGVFITYKTDDNKNNGAIGFYLSDSNLILVILNFNKNIFSFVVLLIFL